MSGEHSLINGSGFAHCSLLIAHRSLLMCWTLTPPIISLTLFLSHPPAQLQVFTVSTHHSRALISHAQ